MPTALTSFLSLSHFHLTVLSHSKYSASLPFQSFFGRAINSTATSSTSGALPLKTTSPVYSSYESGTGTSSYPLLNYIPNVLETVLISTILLTIFLNTLTQLLLTGRARRPLFGLGLVAADGTTTGTWSWSPPWEEDFGILLIRVGLHSLEASGMRGWGNEVGHIVAPPPLLAHTDVPADLVRRREQVVEYGSVEMGRGGVLRVIPGSVITTFTTATATAPPSIRRRFGFGQSTVPSASVQSTHGNGKAKRKVLRGWNNEVRNIDVGTGNNHGFGRDRGLFGIPGVWTVNLKWFVLLWRFVAAWWEAGKGVARVLGLLARGKPVRVLGVRRDEEVSEDEHEQPAEEDNDVLYSKFLSGEAVSDDDEEGDEWDEGDSAFGESASDEDALGEEGQGEYEGEAEAVGLYSDLTTRVESEGGVSSTTILAHMTNVEGSPLTRRRYQSLLKGTAPDSGKHRMFISYSWTYHACIQTFFTSDPLLHRVVPVLLMTRYAGIV